MSYEVTPCFNNNNGKLDDEQILVMWYLRNSEKFNKPTYDELGKMANPTVTRQTASKHVNKMDARIKNAKLEQENRQLRQEIRQLKEERDQYLYYDEYDEY